MPNAMAINGIIISTFAIVVWMFLDLSFKDTSWGNMPEWLYKLGAWSYIIPVALGIFSLVLAHWYAFIGIPFGWALFRFVIHKWFFKK